MSDAPLLPPIANTKVISWNTSYNFPFPYDLAAAEKNIEFCSTKAGEDTWQFAVFLDEELVGGCGCIRGTDVQAHTAIVGYWFGAKYWGRGLASETLEELVRYMTDHTDIEQLSATVYGWNPASRRVLEKNGFENEGVRKGAVRKWDKTTDLWIFGKPLR